MTPDEIWNAAHHAVDLLRDDRMAADQRIISVLSADAAPAVRRMAVPDEPRALHDVINEAAGIFAHRARVGHPRFYAFIPSPASPLSFIGDLLTTGFNTFAGTWLQGSGPTAIEQGLISWLAQQAGLPAEAGGLFVSGGSMANLTALMVARDQMLPPEERRRGVAYVSTQTHYSVMKGFGVLGLLPDQVRKIEVDAKRRLDPDLLATAIATDRAAGLLPFVIVASCGTTNTGSIDDLNAIADLAAREQLWMHVDGAYGASIALSNRHCGLADGLGRADSLSWDAHKWLFQTYGCGMTLVRNRRHLIESFSTNPEYLLDTVTDEETPNFYDYGIELTRPARAMKLWLTLQVMGRRALGDAIDHGVMLAEELEAQIRKLPDWQIVSAAQLGIVSFRYVPPGLNAQSLDELNTKIVRRLVEENIAMPSTTKLDGSVVIRACTISPVATVDDIRSMALEMDALARKLACPGS